MADGGIDETIERGVDSVALALERIWYAFWPVLIPAAAAAAAVAWFVHTDRPATAVGLCVLVAAVILWRHRTVTAALDAGRIRYRWSHAIVHAGAANPPPRRHRQHHDALGPRMTKVERIPMGYRCTVRVGVGRGTADDLHARRQALASCFSTRLHPIRKDGIAVYAIPDDARHCRVTIACRDPLRTLEPIPSPLADADHASVWEPLSFGVYDDGSNVLLDLNPAAGGHVLLAGATGSGKTAALNTLVAPSVLDPYDTLVYIDGKRPTDTPVPWAPCARKFVGDDIPAALDELRADQQLMRERQREIFAAGEESVRPGEPTMTLVIDELGHYLQDDEFTAVLRDLLQRGRSSGLRVIAAIQRPAAEVMDTTLRSQFVHRICLRVMEPETTAMMFGHIPGVEPHNIPKAPDTPGIGWVGGEEDYPRRFRAPYLTARQVRAIIDRVTDRAFEHEVTDLTIPPEWTLEPAAEAEHAAAPDPILVADEPEPDDDTIAAEILAILPLDETAGPTTRELEVLLPHSKRTWWPVFAGLRDDGRVASVAVNARGLLRHYRTGA